MKHTLNYLEIKTHKVQQMIDITRDVQAVIDRIGIKSGQVVVFVPHTTAAVTINENADPDVVTDLIAGFDKAFPIKANYLHYEGNSHAHLKASCIGMDQSLIVHQGQLVLGTWQGLYFCEFDGPRNRQLCVSVMGQ